MIIITNAFPTRDNEDLQIRTMLIALGGFWNFLVGLGAALLIPRQEPYRRTIALIWKANGSLVRTIGSGWDGTSLRSQVREVYLAERDVRGALDNSIHFYSALAHQVSRNDPEEYQLAHIRKATSLVATHISAIGEELETVKIRDVSPELTIKISACFRALERVAERLAVFIILMKPEEELLVSSRVARFHHAIALLREYPLPEDHQLAPVVKRVIHLFERTGKLIESVLARLTELGTDKPIYRS